MTPAEIWYLAEGYMKQQEVEWQRTRWAVWHTAAFVPRYKLPGYEKFMRPGKQRKKSTQEAKQEYEDLVNQMAPRH